ncbi:Uncharacterised protein [Serratia liquefaciens]|nr:Uncharacterised protein [Serratia liquefaciens]
MGLAIVQINPLFRRDQHRTVEHPLIGAFKKANHQRDIVLAAGLNQLQQLLAVALQGIIGVTLRRSETGELGFREQDKVAALSVTLNECQSLRQVVGNAAFTTGQLGQGYFHFILHAEHSNNNGSMPETAVLAIP